MPRRASSHSRCSRTMSATGSSPWAWLRSLLNSSSWCWASPPYTARLHVPRRAGRSTTAGCAGSRSAPPTSPARRFPGFPFVFRLDKTHRVDVTHDFRSDHDRLFHPGNQDGAASRVRPGDGQGGVRRPARRTAGDRRALLRRLRGRRPAHRAGAGRWTAGHDLTGGLLARAGHRGEAGRGDRRGCHREGARARRWWRPPGGHRHRPRWQRPGAASGPVSADPRSRAQRRRDTEHRLTNDIDVWVASARRRRRQTAKAARPTDGDTMSMATRTDTQSPALHGADSHDLIRVQGARGNNLKDVSVEIPKRRLTVFTGVSGSGKSSLVFGTIAAESQRLINETYSAFVQSFMATLARPEVDVLEGLTTAILVDQQPMGADPRSTVGTATDANAMLRILFSRLGKPHIGSPQAFSFNVASISGAGAVTLERAGKTVKERRSFRITGGMCPRCEGRGVVTDIDLSQLYDDSKSLNEGAITVPGYTGGGWNSRLYSESGFVDPDKPIRTYTKKELHDFLHHEPVRMKIAGINMTYEGLIPRVRRSMLAKDKESMQPHVRAFVERAVTFTACPECDGTRLSEAARSSRIKGTNIAEACAMQISDLAEWVDHLDEPSAAPLLAALKQTLDSFAEIGLGYLSLARPSGTLSGGEAQRVKMIRHLSSALTDVTYVFDEPTIGMHPHDIQRMNDLLLRLRDKGNTVLVVEHKPETIAIADHAVDLGPGAGAAGGTVCFEGTVDGLRTSDTITGRHLEDRVALKEMVRTPAGALEIRGATTHNL